MVMCAVFGCKSNNNKTLKNVANIKNSISYYSFPRNEGLCKEWVNKCSRSDKFSTKNARICSRHFSEHDFERNLMHELLQVGSATKKLKPGAIPTVNLYNSNIIPKKMSNDRGIRITCRENKLLVAKLLKSNEVIPAVPDSDLLPTEFVDIEMYAEEDKKVLGDQEKKKLLDMEIKAPDQEKINLMEENKRLTEALENMQKKFETENEEEKIKLMEENQRLKEALENMQKKFETENENLKIKHATTLGKEIQKNKALEMRFQLFEKSVAKVFTPGQIRKLKDPYSKIVHWEVNDIAHAIALHAAGPNAYRWLQNNNHPLPGESTLRRWANRIEK